MAPKKIESNASSSPKRRLSNAVDISDDDEDYQSDTITSPVTPASKITFSFKPPGAFEKYAIDADKKERASKRPAERSPETIDKMAKRLRTNIFINKAEKMKDAFLVDETYKKSFLNCALEAYHIACRCEKLEKENEQLKSQCETNKDFLEILKIQGSRGSTE